MTEPENTEHGKRLVIGAIALILTATITNHIIQITQTGTEDLFVQMARFALTLLLLFFVFKGSSAALFITVLLIGVTGTLAVYSLAVGIVEVATLAGLWMLILGTSYVVGAGLLIFPASVRTFFRRAKEKRLTGHT